MMNVDIQPIPNQSLTFQADNNIWDIVIKETKGVMSVDISRDGNVLLTGNRLAPGVPLIPYPYQENGNFIFLTSNGDYPYYTEFGDTQQLIYASQEELNAIRGT